MNSLSMAKTLYANAQTAIVKINRCMSVPVINRTARYHVNKSRSRKWKPGDPLSFWTRDEVLAELRRDLHLPNDADEYLPGASLACTQSASNTRAAQSTAAGSSQPGSLCSALV